MWQRLRGGLQSQVNFRKIATNSRGALLRKLTYKDKASYDSTPPCSLQMQHTATHCNTLHHTATHSNTLQHTAAHACGEVGLVCGNLRLFLQRYRALLWKYGPLLRGSKALPRKFRAFLIDRTRLRESRALFGEKHKDLLRKCKALLRGSEALLRKFWSLLRKSVAI